MPEIGPCPLCGHPMAFIDYGPRGEDYLACEDKDGCGLVIGWMNYADEKPSVSEEVIKWFVRSLNAKCNRQGG